MKQKLRNIKQKLRNIKQKVKALWCLLAYKRYALVVYNERRARELGNIEPSDVVSLIQYSYGLLRNSDIINELSDIAAMAANDKLVYKEIKRLIKKLEEEQKPSWAVTWQ